MNLPKTHMINSQTKDKKVYDLQNGDEYKIMGEKVIGVNKITEYTIEPNSIDEPTGKIFPKFLDIVENGWASKDNPHRTGIFIKRKSKTLLLTDGKGDFFEPFNDSGSKLKIIGSLIQKKGKL